jgi:fructose-specific phosphotransferase system IIC component
MLYSILLPLHSILRWVVILLAVVTIGRALIGWLGKKPWTQLDNRLSSFFTIGFDIQILIGLILYFISPVNQAALRNFSGAMRNADMRFYAVEHIFMMILALGIAHAGRTLSRKAKDAFKKHRNAAIFYILAILLVLAAIPWATRPLIRFWG